MSEHKLRIDKWLWAARFFKTRSLAKAAIEGGKVQLDGQRIKVSKEIAVGERLLIRQGWDVREVIIEALSDQRRGAPEAQQLYTETDASVARRESEAEARKAAGGMIERPLHRPTKKQRRQIHRFKELPGED
ncbi:MULTISPECIES: S4 domain-containing protein [Haliea]|uniref:RNA-binding S4 domain-containing protein n=1 Tax=Haliea TaxID=475794 RepID=UPI00040311C7|nr:MULTISPECIES: S4 domain-containing protein [Haliea]HCD56504.1 RNA-binding protein [Halieaceae bacterium]MAD63277.1 RNA-binding protein [Haliea sp.]MAY94209.1 RNA-binding protein [Haliea sp.]MBK40046.1 RNA-binding protein [Haliea sp.]MBP70123.1 RNA-binding protein [Haliea sp.]